MGQVHGRSVVSYPAGDGASVDVAKRVAMKIISGTVRGAVERRIDGGMLQREGGMAGCHREICRASTTR